MKFSMLAISPWNFACAMGRVFLFWIQGRPVITPESVRRKRMGVCTGCENNENGLCVKCGCFIDAKVLLSTEECADNPPRWNSLT